MPDESNAAFPTTHWTLVQAVQGGDPESAARAMEELCRGYWYPIYAFLRRSGHREMDAQDFTQAFFHRLITEEAILTARPENGRLRSYLLGVLKRLLSDQGRYRATQRRGGRIPHVSFDAMEAEERYACEPMDAEDPETVFCRAWANDLLSGIRGKLRAVYETAGRSEVFDLLLPFLMWENEPPSHREIAEKIGSSETATRILIHRLRVKFRSLVREEVARTVLIPGEIPGEMEWLQSVLAREPNS